MALPLTREITTQLFLIELWGKDDYHPAEKLLTLEMSFRSNEEASAFANSLKEHFNFPTCIGWVSVALHTEQQQGYKVSV